MRRDRADALCDRLVIERMRRDLDRNEVIVRKHRAA